MNTDNRHENSGHENVSWWINNDEGLYRMAMDCIRYSSSKDAAARAFLNELEECGLSHTPDGASYSYPSVRAVMEGLENKPVQSGN